MKHMMSNGNVNEETYWKNKTEDFLKEIDESVYDYKPLQRLTSEYENNYGIFFIDNQKRDFNVQYAHIYASRYGRCC